MRGVLASTVMLYHYGLNTFLERATGGRLHDGAWDLCVDFFFLLSGFVLCRSFVHQPVGFTAFAIKRIGRLVPLFLVTTLAVLTMQQGRWDEGVILANVLVVQSLLGVYSINGPGWSIPFELVLPAVLLFLLRPQHGWRHARLVLIGLLLVLAIINYHMSGGAKGFTGGWSGILRAACGLGAGGALYLAFPAHRPRPPAWWSVAAILAGFMAMAVGGTMRVASVLFPFLGVAAIWWGADARGVFSSRPLQALGRWSFAIYLTHIPVLLAAQLLFGEAATRGAGSKMAMVGVVLVISAASFKFLETPCMRAAGRLARTFNTPLGRGIRAR